MHNLVAVQWVPAWAVATLMFSTPVASSEQGPFKYEQAWALAGPCCGDSGHDIAVEPDGSFFIVGNFGALDLDGDGRAELKSEGGHDAIILKGRPAGDLAWVRAPRSPAMSFARLTVASDRRGGAFLAGGFQDSMQFLLDQDGRPDAAADPDGKSEGFVATLDNEGAIRQVLAVTGPGHDQPRGVAFALDGQSLSLTGFVRLTADFDGDGVPEGNVRCDNDGDIVWARYELRAR